MAVKAASHWLLLRQNFASFMISNEYRMHEESMFVGFAVCVRVDKSDVLQCDTLKTDTSGIPGRDLHLCSRNAPYKLRK